MDTGRLGPYVQVLDATLRAQGRTADADAVYDLLETEIAPRYYDRGPDGVPHAWVALMKASIRSCAPRFSARRMVKEYVDRYSPALRAGTESARAAGTGPHTARWRGPKATRHRVVRAPRVRCGYETSSAAGGACTPSAIAP